uniref:Branched-chain-amino-acid aminotransferase n=1 Tax=Arundo donax TaxID=35708 RepID=A0A0A9F1A5_ARUDO
MAPLPMSRGRRYRAPFPCGGTQRLLARTVCLTAWTNCSTEGAGMHMRSAPCCIRRAFSSGRNSVHPARSGRRYAFIPSNSPWP